MTFLHIVQVVHSVLCEFMAVMGLVLRHLGFGLWPVLLIMILLPVHMTTWSVHAVGMALR